MISRINTLPTVLLCGLLLWGCSENQTLSDNNGTALKISAGIAPALTRGASSTTALTSGSLGVFLSNANDYTPRGNVQYTYTDGSWAASSPIYLGDADATLCAYYPYSAALTDAASVSLTSQAYASDKDLCYASKSGVNADAPKWDMVLAHAYAEITLNITRDVSYLGDCAVSKVSLNNAGLYTSGTLDISTGAYSAQVAGAVSDDPQITGIASGASASHSLLLVPVTSSMSGNLVITLTVDGKPLIASVDVSAAGLDQLQAGTNYSVGLNIRGGEMSVNGVSVTDWGDSGVLDTQLLESIAAESNCYIIAPGGSVNIPVSQANASDLGAQLLDVTTGWTSEVIWRDNSALSVTTSDGLQSTGVFTVSVNDATASGNALVCIKNGSGTILWSWHIWVTPYDPESENQSFAGTDGVTYTFMDRNLGATSDLKATVGALGLFYQWGRKDPFAGASSWESTTTAFKTLYSGDSGNGTYSSTNTAVSSANNLLTAVRHPGVFYTSSASPYDWYTNSTTNQNNTLWGTTKTVYDPCPAGWRVAPKEAFSNFSTSTLVFYTTSTDWSTYPGYFLENKTTGSWFPAVGCRYSGSGALNNVGSTGYYWSSAVNTAYGSNLFFNSSNVNPANNGHRAYGFALRCVQD